MRHLLRFAAIVMLGVPAAGLGAQNSIVIADFASGLRAHGLTEVVPLRRGVTSSVKIIKDLIDLVPFQMVSISGAGATLGSISNGKTSSGRGFIQMSVTIPGGQALGSVATIKVGLTDEFRFRVTNRGLVQALTPTPDPSTITAGTPFVLDVTGTDIGSPVLSSILQCHTVATSNRSNTTVRFTLTRSANCTVTNFTANLVPGTGANEPPSLARASGLPASLGFSYLTLPSGITCQSQPSISAPNIRQPIGGQTLVFGSGTSSPTNITIRWDSLTTPSAIAAPLNTWIVTRQVRNARSTSPTLAFQTVSTEVRGLSISLPFTIPGSHTVTVRAKNCDISAPSASVTFNTVVQ